MRYITLPLLCLLCISFISSVQTAAHHKSQRKHHRHVKNHKKNPTDEFCKHFVSQCYQTAVKGHTGHVKLVYACHRNGGKYSPSYAFGCKSNGKDVTQDVLNEIGGVYTVTMTQGSTVVVTGTVTDFTTNTISTTSEIDSTSINTSTSTGTTTFVATGTATETEHETVTTAIPITLTSTSTLQVTTTTPVTTTVATSTITSILVRSDPVAIVHVEVPTLTLNRKRSNRVDNSQFCSAFNNGCSQECGRAHSKPRHVVCNSTGQHQYALACYCENGKIETQHALAAVVDQQHIQTVSTISTSISYATVTSTIIAPTTILSTSIATITSIIPKTNTIVSSTTLTTSTTIAESTGQSTTVATSIPVVTSTNTATTTISTTATSTTQIILATMGAVQAFDDSSTSQGFIYNDIDAEGYWVTNDQSQATIFAAVLDPINPSSGLYQFQVADGSGNVLVSETAHGGQDFSKGAYTWAYPGSTSLCGSSGTQPGPPAGHGTDYRKPCETFVISFSADATTLSEGQTVNLLSRWINPKQTTAGIYTWILNEDFDGLTQATSLDYDEEYYTDTFVEVTLRFPY